MFSRESQAKELAQQLAGTIAELSTQLARLQEQQRNDDRQADLIRAEFQEINQILQELERRQYQLENHSKNLLERLCYLESNISADLKDKFLEVRVFEDYLYQLKNSRLEAEKKSLEKMKSLDKRLAVILATGATVIAPSVFKVIKWLIEHLPIH